MIAQFLALVVVNTYSWIGGQGYCAYDFALNESDYEYSNLHIVFRPQYDPQETDTGNQKLDDVAMDIESIGGGRYNWGQTAKIETDCAVTGLKIISATATEDGKKVDLLKLKRIEVQKYEPLEIEVQGK